MDYFGIASHWPVGRGSNGNGGYLVRDMYKEVTARIVAELESGALPWLKPWRGGAGVVADMPRNAVSRRAYSGVNVIILWSEALTMGYPRSDWLTYKQAIQLGGNVRKGEHGQAIIFIARVPNKKAKPDDKDKTFSMMKTYTVFNVAQCDGLPADLTAPKEIIPQPALDETYSAFVQATGARIAHGGDRAFYMPSTDSIVMPPVGAFKTLDSYKATELHELTHWTGAKHRLARDFSGRFKSEAYAFEELIAEIGAAFLCAHLGVTGELRHAGYVANWLKVLKDDNKAIFTAASQASKAADLLRSFSEVTAEESDDIAQAA